MSASRNKSSKSKFSGLRMLWIPGRHKKHKGHYGISNKQLSYQHGHKPNEQWTLGGNKGQEELIKTELSATTEGPSVSSVLPVSCAIAVNVPTTSMKLDEESNKFTILNNFGEEDTEEKNRSEQDHIELKQGEKFNGTLPINDKREPRQNQIKDDVNTIESIGEKSLDDKFGSDRPDGSLYNMNRTNSKKKNKKKKKRKNTLGEEYHESQEDEEDEKVVKCLYYTLMCCECSIS